MKKKLFIYIGLFPWMIAVVNAGRGEWNTFGSYQYYVSGKNDIKPYADGETFCKNNDGEMAMIKTSEIQTFIQNQVSATSGMPYGFYIGLKEVGTSNIFIWNDNSELNYTNWNSGQPSNYSPQLCVAMGWWHTYYANLPWYDVDCAANAPTGFVCQRLIGWNWGSWESWGSCECPGMRQRNRTCVDSGRIGPYSCNDTTAELKICTPSVSCNATMPLTPLGRGNWFPNGSYEYYVSPGGSSRSYEVSKTFCKEREGELALIKNEMAQGFIKTLVSDGSGEPYTFYIGLVYDKSKSMFQWNDGTNLSFTRWDDGEPNNHISGTDTCVSIGEQKTYDANLLWHTIDCITGATGLKGLVCQRHIGRYWETWSSWSICNCSSMMKVRNRTCINSERTGPNVCIGSNFETTNCSRDTACSTTSTAATVEMTATNIYHEFTTPTDMTQTSILSANANDLKTTGRNTLFPTSAITTNTTTSGGSYWETWSSWSVCNCSSMRKVRYRTCIDSGRARPNICIGFSFETINCSRDTACNTTSTAATVEMTATNLYHEFTTPTYMTHTSTLSAIANDTKTTEINTIVLTSAITTTTMASGGRGNWFSNGSYEYYVSPGGISRSYEVSKTFCKEREGELALIKNEMTQGFIKTLVSDGSGEPYTFYIGLVYDKSKSMFQWNDGTNLSFTRWDDGEPNNHISGTDTCVSIGEQKTYDANLLWHTIDCITGATGLKGLVCQRHIGRYWETWSSWSICNCSSMMKVRNRTCINSERTGPNVCIGSNFETTNCSRDTACSTTSTAATVEMTTTNIYHEFTTPTDMTQTSTLSANANDLKTTGRNTLFPTSAITTNTTTSGGTYWETWSSWSVCNCSSMRKVRYRTCIDSGRARPNICIGFSFETINCSRDTACNTTSTAATVEMTATNLYHEFTTPTYMTHTSTLSAIANDTKTTEINTIVLTSAITTTTMASGGRGNWFPNGSYEYYVSPGGISRSYEVSKKFCKEREGELALIKNEMTQGFIKTLVSDGSGEPYTFHIGLVYDKSKSMFQWNDGTNLSFTRWDDGEPNNHISGTDTCVSIGEQKTYDANLLWHTIDCITGATGLKGLVCQRHIGKYWETWSSWSICNCSSMMKVRNRTCINSERTGPNVCIGSNFETTNCSRDTACSTTSTAATVEMTATNIYHEFTTPTDMKQTSTLSANANDLKTTGRNTLFPTSAITTNTTTSDGSYWETWSSWSTCNCSSMMKVRNRTCIASGRAGTNICIGFNFETINCSRDTACNTTSTAATVEMTATNLYQEFTTPTYMTHTSTLSAIANDTKTTEINTIFPTSAITTTTMASGDHNNLLVAIISSIVTLILAAILFGIGLLIRRCKVMRGNSKKKNDTQPQRLSEMNEVVNDVPVSHEKYDKIQTSQLNSRNNELREEKEGNYEIPHNYEEIKDGDHQYEEMNDRTTKEHPYINSMPENEYDA
ncbi:uncharacterized protein LOC144422910 isoform X1 [Styela clava]